MNSATKKKLKDTIDLLLDGATEKDILNKKFNRDRSKMTAWIKKWFEEFTPQEKKLLSFEKHEIVKQPKETNIGVPMDALKILERHEKRLKDLDQYEKRLKDLELKLESQTIDNSCNIDVLHIGDDILKLKSVVRSIRINSDLTDQLNLIAEKHLNYSKTNLWNQMLSEFIEKYK